MANQQVHWQLRSQGKTFTWANHCQQCCNLTSCCQRLRKIVSSLQPLAPLQLVSLSQPMPQKYVQSRHMLLWNKSFPTHEVTGHSWQNPSMCHMIVRNNSRISLWKLPVLSGLEHYLTSSTISLIRRESVSVKFNSTFPFCWAGTCNGAWLGCHVWEAELEFCPPNWGGYHQRPIRPLLEIP